MITPELLERINYLANKKKDVGLSEEELKEQKELREIYLQGIRGQVRDHLSRIKFVDDEEK
ncbi:DUF896 domain-containing protein [Shimazuella kribbensis]|uniref:DUF896 domain-containing protein n=1 Tax=Shimazuella kribbensis TaxID=139808 RepID=UPI0004166BEF|nr:DUF896 domain-containing protein [Shimazuella kribbensis]